MPYTSVRGLKQGSHNSVQTQNVSQKGLQKEKIVLEEGLLVADDNIENLEGNSGSK